MDQLPDLEFKEQDSDQERREKVAAFIAQNLHIGQNVLEEHAQQVEAFKDFEARSYQQEAWAVIWQARQNGQTKGLIHLATGLGKTSIAVVDYAKFVREQEQKGARKPRALFIVHQESILEQANERFHKMLPGIRTQFFKTKQQDLPDADVTFATFQSMSREVHRFGLDYFDYIIYDEAHHTKAKTYERVVDHFEPQFELAMTATPDRMDERDITDHFGEPLYVKTLAEGMSEGYLADVEYTIVGDDAIKEAIANGFEAKSVRDLQRLLTLEMRNEEIVARIEAKKAEIREREGVEVVKTAIYTDSIEYANYIAFLLDADAYHSGMSKQKQKEVLQRFRSDESEYIVVKDMINEGVDVPDIRLIVFLRSTQSRAIFEQQLGRGLRLSPGKARAYVMDFVANIERIEFIHDIAEKYKFYAFGGGSMRRGDQKSRPVSEGQPIADTYDAPRSTFEFSEEIVSILDKYKDLTDFAGQRKENLTMAPADIIAAVDAVFPGERIKKDEVVALNQRGIIPGLSAIYNYFETIDGFNVARGFDTLRYFNKYNEEQLIELANKLSPDKHMSAELLNQLSQNDEFPSASFITRMFGSINAFSRLRGIEVKRRNLFKYYTNQDILDLANDLFGDKLARNAMIGEAYAVGTFPSSREIYSRFGSMVEFNKQRGISYVEYSELSNDELVEMANEIFGDRYLSSESLNKFSKENKFASSYLIATRFGSAAEFNKARGIEIKERINFLEWTNKAIIEHTNSLFGDELLVGSAITKASKEGLLPSTPTLVKRFGSLAEFNQARGVQEVERRGLFTSMSNDEIIRLSLEIQPTGKLIGRDIGTLSKEGRFPSPGNIGKRFGSVALFNQKREGFIE